MGNRLIQKIELLKRNKTKAVCIYLTFGVPSTRESFRLIQQFERDGVDLIELGFPFSDPLADGPTIQRASEQALKNHVTMKSAFDTVKRLRKEGVRLPIIFFSYFNPILHYGINRFAQTLKTCGFDGAIIPDLSLEESQDVRQKLTRQGMSLIQLIAPTTPKARMKKIANASSGFIYYVSLRGVTGSRAFLASDLKAKIREVRCASSKPVLVGFGVSAPKHVRDICRLADGVIVGSAVMDRLMKNRQGIQNTRKFVSSLVVQAHSKR